jgi:hypothetical protein
MKHSGLGHSLLKDKLPLKIGDAKKGYTKRKNYYCGNKNDKFGSELHCLSLSLFMEIIFQALISLCRAIPVRPTLAPSPIPWLFCLPPTLCLDKTEALRAPKIMP